MMPAVDRRGTGSLAGAVREALESGDLNDLGHRLGCRVSADGTTSFVIWAPPPAGSTYDNVWLQLYTATDELDLTRLEQTVAFTRARFPMTVEGEFAIVVLSGVPAGTEDAVGAFYEAVATQPTGEETVIPDALASSMPFGVFAPAEVVVPYWTGSDRDDSAYFANLGLHPGTRRQSAPVNILQVHVATATPGGTLAALTRRIKRVAAAVEHGGRLSPADRVWLAYDAIELMPVEPTIEPEAGPGFWRPAAGEADTVQVDLRKPSVANWGYDTIIAGGAAVNPSILESGRPHELADLAAALHTFPTGPIRLILDLVYGHADNQAVGRLPEAWFTGPDMYGQHLDYRNPIVRTHLLEMQRRKARFGADGLRIDGAQDFTWWNESEQRLEYDDRYMQEMSDVVEEVAGVEYRPWMVFEDGRPWPRPDWELTSTYRAVIDRQEHVVQWGPLTFAHNTPFLVTFWVSKWWRLREIAEQGSSWISGCANHDTLRRGSQVDPSGFVNRNLGATLPEIIERAYDHPAATLLFHGFLPGVPMDFLQATTRTPWSFIRNTDVRYAAKVWGEESRFLDWRVTPADYAAGFSRLRDLGFDTLGALQSFMRQLAAAVAVHGDDRDAIVEQLHGAGAADGLPVSADWLVEGYRAWMDDVHDFCVVDPEGDRLDPAQVGFGHAARAFRQQHPWLAGDLDPGDRFEYRHPTDGAVIFHGLRQGPDGTRVLFIANMEGRPTTVIPAEAAGDSVWTSAVASPGLPAIGSADEPLTLPDGEGVIFVDG